MTTLTVGNYDLDLSKTIKELEEKQPERVLVQLPDGFKYHAEKIINELEKHTDATLYLWLNTNYGSCDIPLGLDIYQFDLIIHLGHAQWR